MTLPVAVRLADPRQGHARLAPPKAAVGLPRPSVLAGTALVVVLVDRGRHPTARLGAVLALAVGQEQVLDEQVNRIKWPVLGGLVAIAVAGNDGVLGAALEVPQVVGRHVRRDLQGMVAEPRARPDAVLGQAGLRLVAVDLATAAATEGQGPGLGADLAVAAVAKPVEPLSRQTIGRRVATLRLAAVGARRAAVVVAAATTTVLLVGRLGPVAVAAAPVPPASQTGQRVQRRHPVAGRAARDGRTARRQGRAGPDLLRITTN